MSAEVAAVRVQPLVISGKGGKAEVYMFRCTHPKTESSRPRGHRPNSTREVAFASASAKPGTTLPCLFSAT
jgi:hypothetical protein